MAIPWNIPELSIIGLIPLLVILLHEDSNKIQVENHSENEDLLFDSDDNDGSNFGLNLVRDLETRPLFSRLQKPYKVMSEAEIRQCQESHISNITENLSISRAEASLLLLHFNWDANAIPEIWFANGQKLREELGLSGLPIVGGVESSDAKDMACGICSGTSSPELTSATVCGHIFCNTCWAGYIGTSIKDGMASLMLRCPDPDCSAPVGQDMITMLASVDDKDIYANYFLRSYIESNPKAKWCPASGCNYAVFLNSDYSGFKVTCECSYSFCFKCSEEFHQPISCGALRKWQVESRVQYQNWITATTKACPNCGELAKMKGHPKLLECPSCNLQFCKLCLVSCVEESELEHVCSEGKLKLTVIEEEEERLKVALQSTKRYNMRLLQWKTHDLNKQAGLDEIQKLQNGQLKAIADKQGLTEADMNFVKEAWLQIVDCERVFKWARVYDYFLLDGASDKRFIFDYLLKRAETMLEHLYKCASELTKYLNEDGPSEEFALFRSHLFSQTWVNKNYFNNMVWAIRKNLSDMNALRRVLNSRMLGITVSAAQNHEQARALVYADNINTEPLICAWCQFDNDPSALCCAMCYHP